MHFVRLIFFLCCLLTAQGEEIREVRFMAYNLENYLVQDRTLPRSGKQVRAPKPEKEIAALISIIAAEKPDILGVCEMGAPAEFQDFLSRLHKAGLDYPYTEYVEALDTERHLALVSRFPIVGRNPQTNLFFNLGGRKQYYKRGILDVTIAVSKTFQLRLLGTHLKSRREVPDDQELLRRGEAHLMRGYFRAVLAKDPESKLLLYGDLNDTINEASIRELMGGKTGADHLAAIDLRDSNGEKWTHYWKTADTYSRIDYVMASRALVKSVVARKSHICRPRNWNDASDHCPLLVVLKTSPGR